MRRRFSIGQILVAVIVPVVAVVAINMLTHSKNDPATETDRQKFTPCPSGTPADCSDRIAQLWKNDARRMPTIAAPTGLRYDHGFVANKGTPAAFFVFQVFVDGSTQPTEITLRISPATPQPYDVKHRGGRLGHLPSGRAYLDFSNPARTGPFLEHVGDTEAVVSWTSSAEPKSLKAAQLDLLGSVTAPQPR